MAENLVPNMDDGLTDAELMKFWAKHQRGRSYRELFPAGGRGTKVAAAQLANYAANKATARSCRLAGRIESALAYERICDSIYDHLPEFARW